MATANNRPINSGKDTNVSRKSIICKGMSINASIIDSKMPQVDNLFLNLFNITIVKAKYDIVSTRNDNGRP